MGRVYYCFSPYNFPCVWWGCCVQMSKDNLFTSQEWIFSYVDRDCYWEVLQKLLCGRIWPLCTVKKLVVYLISVTVFQHHNTAFLSLLQLTVRGFRFAVPAYVGLLYTRCRQGGGTGRVWDQQEKHRVHFVQAANSRFASGNMIQSVSCS